MSTSAFVRTHVSATTTPSGSAPHDTLHVRTSYPAVTPGDDSERLTGVFPADDSQTPFPVVILLHGVNVGPESYRWLAVRLAEAGYAAVTFSFVGELFPGTYGLTPGVDVAAASKGTFGEEPTCSTLRPVLDHLSELHDGDGPLGGALDLGRVGLWGHSAGGTMVLQNADHRWFPEVRAGISFGGHNMVSTALGWDPGTVLPVPDDCPILLAAGTDDGVIARSADRYGNDEHPIDPLTRTFDDAVPDRDGSNVLAWFRGANHFLAVDPHDDTMARGFLEEPASIDEERGRRLLGDLVVAFYDTHLRGRSDAGLDELLAHDLLRDVRRR